MWRKIFNFMTLVSLFACVLVGGLWARGLGHFEQVRCEYVNWSQSNEVHSYYLNISWYSDTLRLRLSCQSLTSSYFRKHGDDVLERTRTTYGYSPGWSYSFSGDDATRYFSPYRQGFTARYWASGNAGNPRNGWILTVPPWLPTLLAAVLPVVWLFRYHKSRHPSQVWQFSLRELLITMTVFSVLLWAVIWLKN